MKYLLYQLRLSALLEMAARDSGQQPTADAKVDTLVNAIFEMLMEVDVRKIDIRTQKLYFEKLLAGCAQLTTTGSQCGAPAQIYVAAAEDTSRQCKITTMQ
jgi:hypothetical protein